MYHHSSTQTILRLREKGEEEEKVPFFFFSPSLCRIGFQLLSLPPPPTFWVLAIMSQYEQN